jgi:hypothetical protein
VLPNASAAGRNSHRRTATAERRQWLFWKSSNNSQLIPASRKCLTIVTQKTKLTNVDRPETYHRRSEEAQRAAEKAHDPEAKRLLNESAQRWHQLEEIAKRGVHDNDERVGNGAEK